MLDINFVPVNDKQNNALLSLNKVYPDFNQDKDVAEITEKIIQIMDDKDTIYIEKPIEMGSVLGFTDTRLVYISNGYSGVSFHFVFPVENPEQEKIEQLEQEIESYRELSEEAFKKVENNFTALLEKQSKLNIYISDFSYCYSEHIKGDILIKIVDYISTKEAAQFNNYMHQVKSKIHEMRFKLGVLSYQQGREYMKLNDQYNDVLHGVVPDEETLKYREKNYNRTEQEQAELDERMNALLGKFFEKEKINAQL